MSQQKTQYIGKRIWKDVPPSKYGAETTKVMVIERTNYQTGKREVITFGQSYNELSDWLDIAFGNCSEFGFGDMLAETFLQGASIVTKKAEYRLWNKPQTKLDTDTQQAFSQVYTRFVALNNETDGARWHTAIMKAREEILQNNSIKFENRTL